MGNDAELTEKQNAVRERLHIIRENIAAACRASGRKPESVSLMAVTKTVDPVLVNTACDAGVLLLGENRVQEFLSKREEYAREASVQFIGHLQTNKVKAIIDKVSMIQSVDSLHLAEEIHKQAEKCGIVMPILLEVNIGGEESKSGVSPDGLPKLMEDVMRLGGVKLCGLMTIPPPAPEIAAQDAVFEKMQALFADMQKIYRMDTLSMGMSGDYESAVRHGATIVRIGSALFGARYYPPKNDSETV